MNRRIELEYNIDQYRSDLNLLYSRKYFADGLGQIPRS